jgi:hypothetical protein
MHAYGWLPQEMKFVSIPSARPEETEKFVR